MHGKTKSFFEDTSIILIAIGAIYGVYYLYSNYNSDLKAELPIEKTIVKIEKKELPKSIIIKKEVEKPKVKITKLVEVKDIKQIIKEQPKKKVVKKEKNVDLKLLRSFLIETQFKIRQNIIYPTDTNETVQDRFLKIKITILKDGNYEQLKFVDGDKDIFDLNKENILKVFPLVIDEKIADDFPRYFRMNIK